jgi:hypothetical protein
MVENAYRTILTNINISTKTAMTAHAVPIVRLLVLTLCREYVMMEAVKRENGPHKEDRGEAEEHCVAMDAEGVFHIVHVGELWDG